jgi:S-adenosylmethionine hydrolase
MPWIFRFPPNRKPKNVEEPRAYQVGVKKLTKAVFQLKKLEFGNVLTEIETNSLVEFESAEKDMLVLEFDNKPQNKHRYFKNLNLKLVY